MHVIYLLLLLLLPLLLHLLIRGGQVKGKGKGMVEEGGEGCPPIGESGSASETVRPGSISVAQPVTASKQ